MDLLEIDWLNINVEYMQLLFVYMFNKLNPDLTCSRYIFMILLFIFEISRQN